jgi:hypothetical protein
MDSLSTVVQPPTSSLMTSQVFDCVKVNFPSLMRSYSFDSFWCAKGGYPLSMVAQQLQFIVWG